MGALVFVCPATTAEIVTEFEIDQRTMELTGSIKIPVHCVHCRAVHEFRVDEGRITDARAA